MEVDKENNYQVSKQNNTSNEIYEGKKSFDADPYHRLNENFDPNRISSVYALTEPSWLIRTFTNWSNSSLKISILTSLSFALGTGVMAVPKAMSWSGLIGGSILLIIGAIFNMFSHYLLSHCQSFTPHHDVYIDLIGDYLGPVFIIVKFKEMEKISFYNNFRKHNGNINYLPHP